MPLLLVLLVTLVSGVRAANARKVPGDFLRYHRAGRLVSTGLAEKLYDVKFLRGAHVYAAERAAEASAASREGRSADPLPEREFKYLPAAAVLLAPLGALHPRTANTIWGAWNGFLVACLFLFAWRFCAGGKRAAWMILPVLALAHAANDNLNLGQLNPSALVPATLGVILVFRRRDVAGGLLVALGAVVKFMPVFLGAWLAWERRWKALAALLLGVAALGWGLPAAALGPARATALTQEYFEVRAHHYTTAKSDDLPGHSIKSFVFRTLGGTPFVTGSGDKEVRIQVAVARVSPDALYWVVIALNLAVIGTLFAVSRGPLPQWQDPRAPPVAGAALAALLLISPEARDPHFLYLALPATTLVYGLVRARDASLSAPPWWKACVALAVVGALLLYTSSSTLLGDRAADRFTAVCAMGWGAAAWFAALLILRRNARQRAVV